MTDEGWVCPRDKLPNMGQNVDIELLNGDVISGYFDYRHYGALGFYENNSSLVRFMRIKYWREKQEKRPDFGKLKKGDLVSIAFINEEHDKVVYMKSIDKNNIYTSAYKNLELYLIGNYLSKIKKITRINLEEKTFEEI